MTDSFVHAADGAAIVAWLVAIAIAGRCLLSFLPPGPTGSHAPRDLPTTWAVSHLLGLALLEAWIALERGAGRSLSAWSLPVVIAIATALRVATLPGAMVPRHEPALARDGWLARVVRVAAIAVAAWASYSFRELAGALESPERGDLQTVLAIASAFAALVLVDHALEVARAKPWVRAVGMLLLAGVWRARGFGDEHGLALQSAVFYVAGAAFSIGWMRRADRRALFLSALAYAAASAFALGGFALSIAGLAGLVLGTPRASRKRVATIAAVALALAVTLAWPVLAHGALKPLAALDGPLESLPVERGTNIATQALAAAMFLSLLVARWHSLKMRGREKPTTSGAPRGHEEAFLLRTIVGGLLLHLVAERFLARELGDPIRPALAMLVLLAGLSMMRVSGAVGES
jgi:hypothetical protein